MERGAQPSHTDDEPGRRDTEREGRKEASSYFGRTLQPRETQSLLKNRVWPQKKPLPCGQILPPGEKNTTGGL